MRPYNLKAKAVPDGWIVYVCVKRKGKILPFTTGTTVLSGSQTAGQDFTDAAVTEFGKAGIALTSTGKMAQTIATSGVQGD